MTTKRLQRLASITCIWCYSPLTNKDIKNHPCTQPDFLVRQSSFLSPFPEKNKASKKISESDLDWYFSRRDKSNSPPWSKYWGGYEEDEDCEDDD